MRGVVTGDRGGALLFALTARSDADLPAALVDVGGRSALERLSGQLRGLGFSRVTVLTRSDWVPAFRQLPGVDVVVAGEDRRTLEHVSSFARSAEGTVLLAHADVVVNDLALRGVLDDPRIHTGVLPVDPGEALPDGDDEAAGVLVVGERDREDLSAVAGSGEFGVTTTDPLSLLLRGLEQRSVPVGTVPFDTYVSSRPRSAAEGREVVSRLAKLDEELIRLDAAVKSEDSLFATFFVSPYSKFVARWAARRGFTPNQVTVASLVVAFAAAVAFSMGDRSALFAGALLLQVSFTLDCVDGQLARYTFGFTSFGAWLDGVSDRVKEFGVYFGLASGAGSEPVWGLAAMALAVLVVRHYVDFGYASTEGDAATGMVQAGSSDGEPRRPAIAASLVRLARGAGRQPALSWAKRVLPLPIGERFLLISVTAVLGGPEATFLALIVWGTLALAYMTAGRVARALTS